MSELILTEKNFEEEVISSPLPVLVDFWAAWCGPCRMMAPTVEAIAQEQDGRLKVGKVNIDEEPALAQAYGVSSIPTLMVFEGGQVKSTSVGVRPKEAIEAMI